MTELDNQKQKRIWIAEDNPTIREMLIEILEAEGHKVVSFCDGSRLISALNEQSANPHLVITDYQMPEADGVKVIDAVRRIYGEALPIVMCSSDYQLAKEFEKRGANHFIPKPFYLPTFIEVIEQCLGTREA